MEKEDIYVCGKCGRAYKQKAKFYQYRDGRLSALCKNCLSMHVNNFDPETFSWILKELDFPFIEAEWNTLRDAAAEVNPNDVGGSGVLGKYLAKMRLVQFKKYGWADSAELNAAAAQRKEEKAKEQEERKERAKQEFERGEISEAQYKTLVNLEERKPTTPPPSPGGLAPLVGPPSPTSQYMREDQMTDLGEELTEEDKLYLAMKWGRLYKPHEWVILERSYNEMIKSFDIQDADTINSLILICKTNLKMNNCIDMRRCRWISKAIQSF